MVPWSYLSSHCKWHLDWFSRFCTAHGRQSRYFTICCHFPPPQNSPNAWGNLDPHLIHCFLGTLKSTSQTASRSVQPLVRPTDRETDHVVCKILFKSILKIQGKDSLKKYLEDTKIRIVSSRYFLQILFRRYFSCISHDISYRVTTTKQSPQILMCYRLLLLILATVSIINLSPLLL